MVQFWFQAKESEAKFRLFDSDPSAKNGDRDYHCQVNCTITIYFTHVKRGVDKIAIYIRKRGGLKWESVALT